MYVFCEDTRLGEKRRAAAGPPGGVVGSHDTSLALDPALGLGLVS